MSEKSGKGTDRMAGEARQINVIQYFRAGNVATANALAGQFGVSSRTIRNDIRALNEQMGGSGIIDGRNGEYALSIIDPEAFRLVYASLLKADDRFNVPVNRRNYCMGRLMRSPEPVLTDELAYEMNVGRTTLVGDLKKLRAELLPYGLRIEGRTARGLVLEGGEIDIRRYVLENCYDTVYKDFPIDEEIGALVADRLRRRGYERDVRKRTWKYVTIMLDRFLTGHFIGHLPDRYYNLTAQKEFAQVDLVVNQIADLVHTGIPIEEKIFLMLPLVGMRTPTDFGEAYKIELDEQTMPLLQRIFDEISARLDITLDSRDFAEELAYHLMYMVNRIRFGVALVNPLLADIRRKYPLAYHMAEIAAEQVEAATGESVSADETGHLASYFGIYLEETQLTRGQHFSVAVVCGTGRVTAKLILVQLKRVLDPSVTVELYSDEKANPTVLNDYDLVLTTVELPYRLDVPVIRIREIFNEQELAAQIERVRIYGDSLRADGDHDRYLLPELMDASRFFRFTEDYYDAALARMAQTLVSQGYADPGFYPRLREREKRGTMVFNDGVALPHTIQSASPSVGVAIGVFAHEVSYGGKPVRIAFLLAVPEQTADDDLLIRLYEEIIDLANDAAKRSSLVAAKTYAEFLLALQR